MIFETKRLVVRKLKNTDLQSFFTLESNPKVLQYATGEPKSLQEAANDLEQLIARYTKPNNDFWIYAIERKTDAQFIGTVALVKDDEDDEIGYRFIEKYWGNGYATEICKGLITYCKVIGLPKIIGYVVNANIASAKIVERYGFKVISDNLICEKTGLPETKYELKLND